MGQRFQIYVRYAKQERLEAIHLQWCWGYYSIIRAKQLLDFISDNLQEDYSMFETGRDAKDAIFALSSLNLTCNSFVRGYDLQQDEIGSGDDMDEDEVPEDFKFKINPAQQDNNDGCLIIDCKDKKVKYAFMSYEGLEDLKCIDAKQYLKEYPNIPDELKVIISGFVIDIMQYPMLTTSECKELFDREYKSTL